MKYHDEMLVATGVAAGLVFSLCVAVAHGMIVPTSEPQNGPAFLTRPYGEPDGLLRASTPRPVRTSAGGTYHVGHGQPGDTCDRVVR